MKRVYKFLSICLLLIMLFNVLYVKPVQANTYVWNDSIMKIIATAFTAIGYTFTNYDSLYTVSRDIWETMTVDTATYGNTLNELYSYIGSNFMIISSATWSLLKQLGVSMYDKLQSGNVTKQININNAYLYPAGAGTFNVTVNISNLLGSSTIYTFDWDWVYGASMGMVYTYVNGAMVKLGHGIYNNKDLYGMKWYGNIQGRYMTMYDITESSGDFTQQNKPVKFKFIRNYDGTITLQNSYYNGTNEYWNTIGTYNSVPSIMFSVPGFSQTSAFRWTATMVLEANNANTVVTPRVFDDTWNKSNERIYIPSLESGLYSKTYEDLINPSLSIPELGSILEGVSGINDYLRSEVSSGKTIDFTKLIFAGNLLTTKFPFSLPFDIKNMINQFNRVNIEPKFDISLNSRIVKYNYELDMTMFNDVVNIVRIFELLLFNIMLLFAVRRLGLIG